MSSCHSKGYIDTDASGSDGYPISPYTDALIYLQMIYTEIIEHKPNCGKVRIEKEY